MRGTNIVPSDQRALIHIPIVHTLEDLGSLKESVVRTSLQRSGRTALKRKAQAISEIWKRIEEYVENLHVPWDKVRIYQDALPVSGKEQQIVNDLAAAGSRNHQLVARLIQKGAILMGTESPRLLLAEHAIATKSLQSGIRAGRLARKGGEADSILTKRDRFIADRINHTLQPGETGILFLGMLHSIEPYLEPDIAVTRPSVTA